MSNPKFKYGDKVTHFKFGEGIILGNYHKRQDGHYYWHIGYTNGTFGYNRESSLRLIKQHKNFRELLLEGEVTLSDIDDFIEKWHTDGRSDESISNFLGLTEEQYALWVECKVTKETDFYSKDEIEAMKEFKDEYECYWESRDDNESES